MVGFLWWYEIERAFYCYPKSADDCAIFSLGFKSVMLLWIFGIALIAGSALAFLSRGLAGGHGVYLMTKFPLTMFVGAMVMLTDGRVGENDVELLALAGNALLMGFILRGFNKHLRGQDIQSGRAWIVAVIALAILITLFAIAMIALNNMDRLI